ncbi:MAG TPA: 3' terminal RNA ribose 2'-O-methyltransferase Hen1, partial [Chloroflexota bacterium]|nr:3' terminal RNA ribose 2'-O-methyltransferase Hen1 [Chloroflexota bacterium]
DLGYLLHKNPARVQSFTLSFGAAHVFYPQAEAERCTAALLLDVDPVGLVRRPHGGGGDGAALAAYVNDRPYVASSFLSVAIAQVYGSALAGRSRDRPELVQRELPLEATLAVLPCRGGAGFLRRLFEPLGYEVEAQGHPLDEQFPAWGESRYFGVTLRTEAPLQRLLSHLYVLVPVLDDEKHYWVGEEEVEKLLRHGEGWLATHPEREQIARRYLRHQATLTRAALGRLVEEDTPDPDGAQDAHAAEEAAVERRIGLDEQRRRAVLDALKACGARRVIDLGCGEGKLLQALLGDPWFADVAGMDVSSRALALAELRLGVDSGQGGVGPESAARGAGSQARERGVPGGRLRLFQGTLTYRDRRLEGYDGATVVEVIEHLDPARLRAFEEVLFGAARPATVVLTTPNVEYNARFEHLPAGRFRHHDHQFEWTRAQFEAWGREVAGRHGYSVRFEPVGPVDPDLGAPTQMGVFRRD